MEQENIEYKQLAAAVRKLLTCERVPRNTVHTCCSSKDRIQRKLSGVSTFEKWEVLASRIEFVTCNESQIHILFGHF